jgi:hypothetical protein
MSPSAKGTRKVSEPSNNFNNPDLRYVIAPEAPVSGGAPAPETPDRKRMSLRNKLLLGGAGLALVAAGATGVGFLANANGAKAPEATSSSAPADPSAEPSTKPEATSTPEAPSNTAPDRYDFGITEADVASLQSMDLASFNNLSPKERAPLALFYAQDLPKFAADWGGITENPLDTVPSKIDENNTPEQVVSIIYMAHRQAMTLSQSDGTFDKAAADRLIDASLINGNLSQAYGSLTAFTSNLKSFGGLAGSARSLAASNYMAIPKINHASEKYTNAAGYTCTDINITEVVNNVASTGDFTACLMKVGDAEVWMEQ